MGIQTFAESLKTGSISRRGFIAGASVGLAAISQACGNSNDSETERTRELLSDRPAAAPLTQEWRDVREQFAIRSDLIDLSALLISSHPRTVREAIDRHRRGLDEDPVGYLRAHSNENERRILDRAAEYLNTSSGDIAITDSTTMGLGLIYNGIHVGPGQEILTTDQNYYSTDEALRLKAEKSGASVRSVPLYGDSSTVSAAELTASVVTAISPATRVVALTWVHSSTGLKLPLAEISAALDDINDSRAESERILLGVDGVHGFGVEDLNISDLGCDYFAAGCHKWLFGPRGTGIVWASSRGWNNVSPTIPTFMDNSVRDAWVLGDDVTGGTTGRRISPGGFKPFEHQWAMTEAFDFHLDIGKSVVAERTHALARQLKEGLTAMPHVRLHTPIAADLSSGIVCFDVNGMSPRGVVTRLRDRNIVASVTPYADPHARLSPSIRNSETEIETTLQEIDAMA